MSFSDASIEIFDALATEFPEDFQTGLYFPAGGAAGIAVRVHLARDLTTYPEAFDAQVNERRTEIELFRSEVDDPMRDSIVALTGASYKLKERKTMNSYRTRWAVTEAEL